MRHALTMLAGARSRTWLRGGSRWSLTAATEVVQRLGHPSGTLHRLSSGSTSSVYALGDDWIVSIAPPEMPLAKLRPRVELAAALSRHAPFVEPIMVDQPVATSFGLYATVWHHEPVVPAAADWFSIGAALRALHDIDPAHIDSDTSWLSDPADMSDISTELGRLRAIHRLSAAADATLTAVVDRLAADLANAPAADNRLSVLHGDMHLGNVLNTKRGAVFCDIDEFGFGHPDWDVAFLLDFGRAHPPTAAQRAEFASGYGHALPSDERIRALVRIAHLRQTVRTLGGFRSVRSTYWNVVRVGAWQRMLPAWSRDLVPAVERSRSEQAKFAAAFAVAQLRRHH